MKDKRCKPLPRRVLADTLVEYTWRTRTNCKNLVKCPKCSQKGEARYLEDECLVVHREMISDFDRPCYIEACSVDKKELDSIFKSLLHEKEYKRKYYLAKKQREARSV